MTRRSGGWVGGGGRGMRPLTAREGLDSQQYVPQGRNDHILLRHRSERMLGDTFGAEVTSMAATGRPVR